MSKESINKDGGTKKIYALSLRKEREDAGGKYKGEVMENIPPPTHHHHAGGSTPQSSRMRRQNL